jgi:nucleotide-binding universal stress UspA family protein
MGYETIVVGTDGSATAERALEQAGELAQALGATVHVVNCCKTPSGGALLAAAGGMAVADVASDAEVRKFAGEIVTRARNRLRQLGVKAQGHVCSGDPADALINVAADEGAQLIVVGNRGMSGARRALGSVPNSVSHRATCGVLIVPTG